MLRLLLVGVTTALWTSVLILTFGPKEDPEQAELALRALMLREALSFRSAEELETFTNHIEKNCSSFLEKEDWPASYKCVSKALDDLG